MKVLHINCNYITTALHQNLVRKLNEKQVDSTVFVPVCNEDLDNAVIEPDEYVRVSNCYRKWDRIFFQYKQRKIQNSIKKNVKNIQKMDIIHAYTLFSDGNVAYEIHKHFNIPYIVTIRDTDVNAFLKYMYHLRNKGLEIMLHSEYIVFLSSVYKEEVFSKYVPLKYKDKLLKKSLIIPNGIDDFWFENINKKIKRITNNVIKIISVGTICDRKNPLAVVEAAKLLIQDGYSVKVTFVGNCIDKKLKSKIIEYSFVKYIEKVGMDELISYYRENDLLVVPSKTETFGLVYAEAMSQGLPVIYTYGQGFDSQFEEGYIGYHVDARNARDIESKILKVIERYDEVSRNTIKCIEKFKWDNIATLYNEIYKKINN